jgi:hypothetical protein
VADQRFLVGYTMAPGPDHVDRWCARCEATTWHREVQSGGGNIELAGKVRGWKTVTPVCRRCAESNVVPIRRGMR